MTTIKKSAKAALRRGRDAALDVGKVAKTASVEAAKAGARAAITTGTDEFKKGMKDVQATRKRAKARTVAAIVAGAAALTAAGVAIARRGSKR